MLGLPARCKAVAQERNLNVYDIDVFNVHYDDCDAAWVFCRHHDAQVSLDQMIDNFGRMPVRLRNMVRAQFGEFLSIHYSNVSAVGAIY
jgi:hypothetical protein